jgi:hypothetical protein
MARPYPGDLNGYPWISDRDRENMYRQMADRTIPLTPFDVGALIAPKFQPEENQKLLLLEDLS